MRVGHRHELQELLDALLAAAVLALHVDGDLGAVVLVPLDHLVGEVGAVLGRVDRDLEVERDALLAGLRAHAHGIARRQQAIHARSADADALLAAALAQTVELAAVEQAAEHVRHLCLHDAGTVVLDAHRELLLALADARDLDLDLRQDAGFLARVEAVVDGFLDRGEERLARAVEAEQVAVLGEELADRDLALPLRHLLCGLALPLLGLVGLLRLRRLVGLLRLRLGRLRRSLCRRGFLGVEQLSLVARLGVAHSVPSRGCLQNVGSTSAMPRPTARASRQKRCSPRRSSLSRS